MFRPNIDSRGRAFRALGGLAFAAAGVFAWPYSRLAAVIFGVIAVFMFFEAARGWCAARACGIKTRL